MHLLLLFYTYLSFNIEKFESKNDFWIIWSEFVVEEVQFLEQFKSHECIEMHILMFYCWCEYNRI